MSCLILTDFSAVGVCVAGAKNITVLHHCAFFFYLYFSFLSIIEPFLVSWKIHFSLTRCLGTYANYITAVWKVTKSWTGSKMKLFYRISELMLATLIQRYDKNYFIFDPVRERETNWNFTGSQVPHFMIVLDCTNTIYLFIKPFLVNKMSLFFRIRYSGFWQEDF